MKRKLIFALLPVISAVFFSCNSGRPEYPQDRFILDDGSELVFTSYTHASIAIDALGHRIYIDPAGDKVDWSGEPEADLVLITHDHYDHLDTNAVALLAGAPDAYTQLSCGEVFEPFEGILIKAVPAYNISPEQLDFHPRVRGDVGYLISVGGKTTYISGDTEDTWEAMNLRGIDYAFICCNQPYTMTVEQCVRVVKAISPKVFFPYHYGGTDIPTDMIALQDSLKDVTEVRIRPLD